VEQRINETGYFSQTCYLIRVALTAIKASSSVSIPNKVMLISGHTSRARRIYGPVVSQGTVRISTIYVPRCFSEDLRKYSKRCIEFTSTWSSVYRARTTSS